MLKQISMRRLLSYPFLVLPLLFTSCKKPIAFEYRNLTNLKLENISSEKSEVSLNLVYFNPNNFGVDLKNVNCEVFIDSIYVGKFKLDTMMHISKISEFSLPARFEVSMQNILKNSINLLFNEVTLSAKGTTRVGKSGIYVTVPIEYSGKHKLNLF